MSWVQVKIGSLCAIKHGYAFKGEYFSDRGEYILLTPGNFQERGGLKLKGDKEKYYVGEFPKEYLLAEGDMLVVLTDLMQAAPILGGAALIPKGHYFLHNQRLGKITSIRTDVVTPGYLYYLFNSPNFRSQVRASATGSTVRHTAPERIYKCEVLLPDLDVQDQIANILSAYDDLIENNLRRIQLLEEAARCRYKLMMENGPKVQVSVFDYAHVLSGGTPKTTVDKFWGGDIMFFTPKDMSGNTGFHLQTTERTITEDGLRSCNSDLFPEGTVFITARGTVGKLILVRKPAAMSQSSYALRTKDGSSQLFLFLALQDRIEHFKQMAVGGVFDTIIVDTFKNITIEVPTSSDIDRFDQEVRPYFKLMGNLQDQVTRLRQARDLLLPRLMSGEIDVSTVAAPKNEAAALELA